MTRLRSDAGSFVRSPAGAFDSEASVDACGFVQTVQNIPPPQVLGIDSSICRVTINNNPPITGGRQLFTIQFVAGFALSGEAMLDTVFTGVTSGVSWSARQYNIAIQCFNAGIGQYNSHDDLGPLNWGASVPGGENIDTWGYIVNHNTFGDQSLTVHRSSGAFPGAPPLPAFIEGEEILCETPPSPDRTAFLDTSLNNQGWAAPETSPSCYIGDAFGGGPGAIIFFRLTIDTGSGSRAPTPAEYAEHFVGTTWQGDNFGELMTFDAGAFFCGSATTTLWIPATIRDRVQISEGPVFSSYVAAIINGDSPFTSAGGESFTLISEAP